MTTSGKLGVVWETSDPAKEYVVEYRLKGTGEWLATSALTGNYGILNASFNVGDVVEARIKALASSVKDESQWSDVVEYTIAAPVAEYTVRVVENKVGSNTVDRIERRFLRLVGDRLERRFRSINLVQDGYEADLLAHLHERGRLPTDRLRRLS